MAPMDQRAGAGTAALRLIAPELTRALLAWWEIQGRKDAALKPWMFTEDGRWPEPLQQVDPTIDTPC